PAFPQELEDFPFAGGEAVLRVPPGEQIETASPGPELVDDPGHQAAGQRRLASQHPLEYVGEALRVEPLEEVADGPGLECGEEVLVLLRPGQHHHGRCGSAVSD